METGTSRKKRFLGMLVPGITSELLRQRWKALGEQHRFFRGGPWLIGEKQRGYSCQTLRMNANKSASSPKRALLRKKGATHSIRKLTQQIHHTLMETFKVHQGPESRQGTGSSPASYGAPQLRRIWVTCRVIPFSFFLQLSFTP